MAVLCATSPVSSDSSVPAPLAVKIIMASVAFDRTLDERFGASVEIGVVGDGKRAAELTAVLNQFSKKKLKGKSISVVSAKVADIKAGAVDVVFFADELGGEAKSVAAAAQAKGVTTIAATEDDVAAGLMLGIELTDSKKPKLLINLDAARATGAEFSSQILKLARIVEPK